MYYFILRGYTENDNYTDTDPSDPIITAIAPTNLNLILAIVFGIIGALVVVAVIVIVVMVRRRGVCVKGTARSTTSGDGTPLASVASDRRKKYVDISRPVKIAAFGEHCKRMAADSDLGYSEEYEDLKSVGRDQACSAADLPANRNKNRFTNILPYDHSRVKLLPTDDEDGSDYINANWMPGYNSKREFVVTQGPLPSTRDDFWRMVWEQNCRAIVMVTKCVEKGREKCDHYWPVDSEPMYYGDLRVLVLNETKCSDWVVSEFELSQGDQIRRLVHFHYTGWPDFGVPEKLQSLIRFVRLVRTRVGPEGGPIVVHCSAGVGRSGTYITLDRIFQIVQDAPDQESTVDIYSIVNEMRRYRMYMVQTEQQYICVHDCLKCVIEGTENDDNLYANGNDNDGYEQDEGIEDN
jgi:cadherin 5 type 2 (VE-cadherin)